MIARLQFEKARVLRDLPSIAQPTNGYAVTVIRLLERGEWRKEHVVTNIKHRPYIDPSIVMLFKFSPWIDGTGHKCRFLGRRRIPTRTVWVFMFTPHCHLGSHQFHTRSIYARHYAPRLEKEWKGEENKDINRRRYGIAIALLITGKPVFSRSHHIEVKLVLGNGWCVDEYQPHNTNKPNWYLRDPSLMSTCRSVMLSILQKRMTSIVRSIF